MITQLDNYGLEYEFVSNFGREILTNEQKLRFNNLNTSEISLFLHQIECYKRIVDSNLGYGVVLEDDVIFGEDFKNNLEKYINELPENWDMLFFGEGHGVHIPVYRLVDNKNVYLKSVELNNKVPGSVNGATRCADSYIISNKCCKKILSCFSKIQLIKHPFDHFLNKICYYNNLNVFWSEPTITVQGTSTGLFKSSLRIK
jgi:GR25 family glycosyltransferase involved in LPS biosynthesis